LDCETAHSTVYSTVIFHITQMIDDASLHTAQHHIQHNLIDGIAQDRAQLHTSSSLTLSAPLVRVLAVARIGSLHDEALPCAWLWEEERHMEGPWPSTPGCQCIHSAVRPTAGTTIEHHDLSRLLEATHESQHVAGWEDARGSVAVIVIVVCDGPGSRPSQCDAA
jgi:hypothetical protein